MYIKEVMKVMLYEMVVNGDRDIVLNVAMLW